MIWLGHIENQRKTGDILWKSNENPSNIWKSIESPLNTFENQSKTFKINDLAGWDYDFWILLGRSFRTMDSILKKVHSV